MHLPQTPYLLSTVCALLLSALVPAQGKALFPEIAANEGKVFGLVEIHLPLETTYKNPFDPEEVSIQGHFQGPDGAVTNVDGFVDQDYTTSHGTNDTWDHVAPHGDPFWAIRFAPVQAGAYTWWVTQRDSAGESDSAKSRFVVADDPTATGFIRVAANRTNFQDGRGAPFYAIGVDMAWPTAGGMFDFEKWMSRFSENHGNAMRVFMTWLDVPLERIKVPEGGWRTPFSGGYVRGYILPELNERTQNGANDPWSGLGKIDLANAYRYDHVLDLARRDGIHLMFCQTASVELMGDWWARNPYNKVNGGPTVNGPEILGDPVAKAFFKRRLRYVVARYGWSPNVLAWELFNEVDTLGRHTKTYSPEASATWHQEMAKYLKEIDPNKHLVTTSVGYDEVDYLYSIPEIDFAQGHPYNFQDSVPIVAYEDAKETAHFGKPQIFGEFGLEFLQRKFFGGPVTDPKGINIETGLWASLASPGAGTVWPWYWDNYIDPQHLWPLWKPVTQFAAGVPWNKVTWKPLATPKISYASPPPMDSPHQLLRLVGPYNWGMPKTKSPAGGANAAPQINGTFKVAQDGTLNRDLIDLPLYMQPDSATHPLTFMVDYAQAGKFQILLRCVGKDGATLEIRLDGRPLLTKEFAGGAKDFQFQFNGTYSIDVPAGQHKIEVLNTTKAPQGLFSGEYDFVNYLDPQAVPLKFCGMTGDKSMGILYFYNQDYTWGNIDSNGSLKPVAPSTCVIPTIGPGQYKIEFWSPSEGIKMKAETATAGAEGLKLELPEVKNDLAIKILPAPM